MASCPLCSQSFADDVRFCPVDGAPLGSGRGAGEVVGERYRIVGPLGEGGMSSVFRAEHLTLGRPFALKFLSQKLLSNAEAVGRFEREAKLAASLRHPNLAGVLDFGRTAAGELYLVMEFIEGTDLRTVVRQQGVLPLSRVREVVRQVCSALAHAHAQGVVHRDLKSANIMLTPLESGEHVQVVDFGISKALEGPDLTMAGTVVGTPEYMSPEQVSGKPLDGRSDLYSLGIVIYEMLGGVVPFSGPATKILADHLTTEPPPLSALRLGLPPPVEAVVMRALAKDPEARFPSARVLGESFDFACAAGEETAPLRGATAFGFPATPQTPVPAGAAAGRGARIGRRIGAGAVSLALAAAAVLWPQAPTPSAEWEAPAEPAMSHVPATAVAAPAPRPGPAGLLPPPATPSAPQPAEARQRALERMLLRRYAEARKLLEGLTDVEAVCLRAQAHAAMGEADRAVTDVERCVDLDPRRRDDPNLARAVVQGLATKAQPRALKLLSKELAVVGKAPLLEAARDSSPRVRDAAHQAALKLGHDMFDLVAKLILDLGQSRSCRARRRIVVRLCQLGDRRALPYVEREISRPRKEIACFNSRAYASVRALRQAAAAR